MTLLVYWCVVVVFGPKYEARANHSKQCHVAVVKIYILRAYLDWIFLKLTVLGSQKLVNKYLCYFQYNTFHVKRIIYCPFLSLNCWTVLLIRKMFWFSTAFKCFMYTGEDVYAVSCLCNKIKVHWLQISPDKSFLLCMHGCLCLFVLLLSFFLSLILLSPWVSSSCRIRPWRSQSVVRYFPSMRAIHSTGTMTSRSMSTSANFPG